MRPFPTKVPYMSPNAKETREPMLVPHLAIQSLEPTTVGTWNRGLRSTREHWAKHPARIGHVNQSDESTHLGPTPQTIYLGFLTPWNLQMILRDFPLE